MKPKTARRVATGAIATVLVATSVEVLDQKVFQLPETHVETVMLLPTGNATLAIGNTTSEAVTFTSV